MTTDKTNVVTFPGITKNDLDPSQVLDAAIHADLTDVLVMGWLDSGEFYCAASIADVGGNLLLLEKAREVILKCLK